MINFFLFLILIFLISYETFSAECNQHQIICKTICIQDGDEAGLFINKKCYCMNERDINKVILKIPQNYNPPEKPKYYWDY